MSERKLTFNEYVEDWLERNNSMCSCSTSSHPPCGFCEGAYLDQVKDEYEEYLEEFEEEKINE